MKHNYFQDEKLKYEDTEIPDELLLMVRQTVAADRRRKAAVQRNRILRAAAGIAAILFLCLTIGVNSSYAFAETAVKIPVVKNIAKTVVVRSYRPEIIAVYEQNKSGKTGEEPEAAPDTEQPKEEAPAVSGNDAVSEDVVQPEAAEPSKEEALEGLDAWKAEMTPEKFKEVTERYTPDMEERYADSPEKLRTILLAELPEKEVSLYGYHEDKKVTGVAILIEDSVQYFDWNYMNESRKLPDISAADIDEDGEDEIIVYLYNGVPQKKEISKEDIAEPGTESAPDADIVMEADAVTDENNTDETEAGNDTKEGMSAKEPSVSDNDPGPAEKEEKPQQPAGEIWVVSPKGENWRANMLSVDDYESQILHQVKAEYDETAKTVQLYLVEETFGDPVKLQAEGTDGLTYESLNIGAEREFKTEDGLTIYFKLEVGFQAENKEEKTVVLEPKLKAEIKLEGDSLTIENIRKA